MPVDSVISRSGDEGMPIVIKAPNSKAAKAYKDVSQKISTRLENNLEGRVLTDFEYNWEDIPKDD